MPLASVLELSVCEAPRTGQMELGAWDSPHYHHEDPKDEGRQETRSGVDE